MQNKTTVGSLKMQSNELKVVFFVGGELVESLTPEQRASVGERISSVLNAYYKAHPEEYADLFERSEKCN